MAPAVSILLPVFNAADTLESCLESIRGQTLRDWECIVVDDGSTDGSGERIGSVAVSDDRFVLVRHDHSGLIPTLNAGIDRCRGELVARMDADDRMHRERLALQMQALKADPTLDLVGSHVRSFPRSSLGAGSLEYEAWLNAMRTPEDVHRERFIECPLAHPTWMLRRSVLERLRYRDRGWPEDYDLILRVLRDGPRAGSVPQRLLDWRHHPQRLSRTDARYALDRFTACRAWHLARDYLRDTPSYLLWGYGQTGRALRRALADHGRRLAGLIEVHRGRIGQTIHGAPVVSPEEIGRLGNDPLIVSVSGAGPRAEIRAKLQTLDRIENRDYVCAA
ncbi:MAG: glycosyltransferase [Acidobacteria bacterium]|nr:glycosyltransferase [Acidobacteriota bacterium]NIM61865.1 glycosyltransferase [Acidobacteriota bacterium]NIO60822.1 glycosyltransferase [Acidobacteriota bacterium]NIQ31897.1 glycosyltransferase [Acidobacteriota bacterium]NIQ87274.1 glycosyltransferase [Acidobacteriota bacterium]